MQNMYGTAKGLESLGRGNDSMLVHMTPREVGGLQALARAKGGSLTINPNTGLPEAGFLEDILPTILGLGLSFTGLGPLAAAGITGLGTTALTGDLQKGLMAGLGAFGGASLGSGLGFGADTVAKSAGDLAAQQTAEAAAQQTAEAAAQNAVASTTAANSAGQLGADAITQAATQAATQGAGQGLAQGAAQGFAQGAGQGLTQGAGQGLGQAANLAKATASPNLMQKVLGPQLGTQVGDFGNRFAQAASGAGKPINATRTGIAALGVANPVMNAMAPSYTFNMPEDGYTWNYAGPRRPPDRQPRSKPAGTFGDTSEFTYFGNSNPMRGYAEGGMVLPENSFVVDARTVSELGNGSSGAGQEFLARMGGRPVQGSGDGVSDSIPASVGGMMPARVARDEVVMPPQAVAQMGAGDLEKGTAKLYALMDKAESARKQAPRGTDSKLKKAFK